MAGAFALGAEGVLMGTRFMSAAESLVRHHWKQAIADCDATVNSRVLRFPRRITSARAALQPQPGARHR